MTHTLNSTPPVCSPTQSQGDLIPFLVVVAVVLAARILYRLILAKKGSGHMKTVQKGLILAGVGIAVVAVLWMKQSQKQESSFSAESAIPIEGPALPRLVDLGADKCTSCKLMAPILTELGTTYTNQLQVTFIDVWVHEEAADPYHIQMIPTQIYFDENGQELYRHEGFFSKKDILSKWKELGYEFQ